MQPSHTWAKNYLQHLSRSQLNKAHHTFDKNARLCLSLKSEWIEGPWDMKKRREKSLFDTSILQATRPETRKREWSVREVTLQKRLLPMEHPSSDPTPSLWGRLPAPAVWVSLLTPGCCFLYVLLVTKSPITSLWDLGSEDTCEISLAVFREVKVRRGYCQGTWVRAVL